MTEVDGHGEGRQEKTEEVETGMAEAGECEGVRAWGCSSKGPPCAVSAPEINCLVVGCPGLWERET